MTDKLPPLKRSPLHDIAPYPAIREDADAEGLIRHYAAFGEMHSHLAQTLTDKNWERQSMGHVMSSYVAVYLLSELRQRAGWEQADEVAREMWVDLQGGALPPILWSYVTEEGMSHEAIADAAKAVEANIRAKCGDDSPEIHPGQVTIPAGGES